MTDRYTDKKGRIHRVIHSLREDMGRDTPGEHERRITDELVRILMARAKEERDGNCPVRKEIR